MDPCGASSGERGRKLTARIALLFLLFSLTLGALGGATIRPRSEMSGDALMYQRMAEHGAHSVPPPFCYRVLVPLLASLVPPHPPAALLLITHISAVMTLFVALLCCWETGVSTAACLGGGAALFCSRVFLYQYHNPYLTDAPGLLVVFLLLYFNMRKRQVAFTLTAIPGLFIRESTVFLVPAVLFSRKWKHGVVICALCAAFFLYPRFVSRSGYYGYLQENALGFNFHHLGAWSLHAALSWYLLWPMVPLGLILLRRHTTSLAISTGLLTAGCIVSAFVASDTERMFAPMAPVITVAVAQVFDFAWRRKKVAFMLLIAVPVGGFFFANPYVRADGTSVPLIAAFSVAALIALTYALATLPVRTAIVERIGGHRRSLASRRAAGA